jgi:hypothetical protein
MREYELATVCKWIGDSPAVAAKHYAMSVDLNADFAKAVGPRTEAQQKAQQTAVCGDQLGLTSPPRPETKKPRETGVLSYPANRLQVLTNQRDGRDRIRTCEGRAIRFTV